MTTDLFRFLPELSLQTKGLGKLEAYALLFKTVGGQIVIPTIKMKQRAAFSETPATASNAVSFYASISNLTPGKTRKFKFFHAGHGGAK